MPPRRPAPAAAMSAATLRIRAGERGDDVLQPVLRRRHGRLADEARHAHGRDAYRRGSPAPARARPARRPPRTHPACGNRLEAPQFDVEQQFRRDARRRREDTAAELARAAPARRPGSAAASAARPPPSARRRSSRSGCRRRRPRCDRYRAPQPARGRETTIARPCVAAGSAVTLGCRGAVRPEPERVGRGLDGLEQVAGAAGEQRRQHHAEQPQCAAARFVVRLVIGESPRRTPPARTARSTAARAACARVRAPRCWRRARRSPVAAVPPGSRRRRGPRPPSLALTRRSSPSAVRDELLGGDACVGERGLRGRAAAGSSV